MGKTHVFTFSLFPFRNKERGRRVTCISMEDLLQINCTSFVIVMVNDN